MSVAEKTTRQTMGKAVPGQLIVGPDRTQASVVFGNPANPDVVLWFDRRDDLLALVNAANKQLARMDLDAERRAQLARPAGRHHGGPTQAPAPSPVRPFVPEAPEVPAPPATPGRGPVVPGPPLAAVPTGAAAAPEFWPLHWPPSAAGSPLAGSRSEPSPATSST
ncbi:hypothetical protein [Nonomuraea sp. NPDC050310]|uniref:hypothetical protein n=1 Tax=Nonomuraea sp. NPDC050310 TaxID=3154935 RepID=UPI0033CF9FED